MMHNKKLPTIEWVKKLDIQGGTQPPRSQFIDTPQEGYIRLIQIRDFESEKYITYVPKTSKLKTCNKEDLFIARYGASIGRILRGLEGAYNVALAKVILKDDTFNKDFLFYFLQSNLFQNHIRRISSRSAQSGFNKNDLANIPVPNPFIKEQQKIAAILSSVDEAIEKTEQIIEKTELVKKGLMQELLNKGIRHTDFKDSLFGSMPKSWKGVKLGDILDVSYGRNQRNVETEISEIPILGTGGIIGYATEPLYDKPSVLIGRKGTIDKPQYMDKPFWTIDTLFYTKINEMKAIPKFLYFLFSSINWKAYNEATGVPSLSAWNISRIKVKLPPIEEQEKITEILDEITNKTNQENYKITMLNKIKQGLMQQLLTGKKRVKVDDSEEVLS